MHIDIRQGTLLDADTEAVACALSGAECPDRGACAALRAALGERFDKEVVPKLPLDSGQVITLTPGPGTFRAAFVVGLPPVLSDATVAVVTRALLDAALAAEIRSLALPGLACDGDEARVDRAAAQMFQALKGFEDSDLDRVLLIDTRSSVVAAWTLCVDAR